MQFHQLKRNKGVVKSARVGRGGKRGKTSGKGTKGQKARAGRKLRPEIRDFIKRLPKQRGYRFKSIQTKASVVNLSQINEIFESGAVITPQVLVETKIVNRKGGKIPQIKILAVGDLSKKVNISGCLFSKIAKEKIEKAGGKIK